MKHLPLSQPLIVSGLLLVLALFAEEAWHLHRWDSKGEARMVPISVAATACTLRDSSPVYRWYDVPGYGRALYRCVKKTCYYLEPSAPPLSPQQMEKEDDDMGRMFDLEKHK